jgi:hypothetical protein
VEIFKILVGILPESGLCCLEYAHTSCFSIVIPVYGFGLSAGPRG